MKRYFLFCLSISLLQSVLILTYVLSNYVSSKRTSGFDQAPPASALLASAASTAGTLNLIILGLLYFLNCFFFVVIVWKVPIKLHGVVLVRYILFCSFICKYSFIEKPFSDGA